MCAKNSAQKQKTPAQRQKTSAQTQKTSAPTKTHLPEQKPTHEKRFLIKIKGYGQENFIRNLNPAIPITTTALKATTAFPKFALPYASRDMPTCRVLTSPAPQCLVLSVTSPKNTYIGANFRTGKKILPPPSCGVGGDFQLSMSGRGF